MYGKSGAGKTRSLKNFDKDEICLIQCTPKMLPFKGKFTKQMGIGDKQGTEAVAYIAAGMKKAAAGGTKAIVIDDATYIMTKIFMEGHRGLRGNQAFELYNDIGDNMYLLVQYAQSLPEDVIVYIVMHEDVDDFGNVRLRTIGKLLDQKVCLEGMVTICLRAVIEDDRHLFETNNDGRSLAKSPEDMFESRLIDNDLKAVDTAIRNFYEIGGNK